MLSSIRKLLDNWLVRAFFIVLIAVFIFWGVSSVVTSPGGSNTVATVGGQPIEAGAVNAGYQRALNAYTTRSGGKEPGVGERRLLAERALGEAIDRVAMALDAKRLGVVAPPAAIRQQVFAMSVFNGPDGKFDRSTFEQVLAQHNLTPARFMADIAGGLKASQIVQAVAAGASAPKPLVDQLFAYIAQRRTIQYVRFPLAAANPPPPPAAQVLRRYWRNHPDRFSTPAMREARIVILSPALIAPDLPVSPAEIAAQYASEKSKFRRTASRTVEIVTAADKKSADALAAKWKAGADWAAMKRAAATANATAITFTDVKPEDLPSATLAKAVFAATPKQVSGPVAGQLGTYVFKVTKASPGGDKPLAAVKAAVKAEVQQRKARDVVDATVSRLQDALAGNTALGKLPADLHLVSIETTIDAAGNTADGRPAPIPGPKSLHAAILKSVVSTPPGQAPRAMSGPDDSYYAVSVRKIIKPALKPYDKVKSEVLADWTGAQVERQEEVAAARLLAAVKAGKTLAAAADAAGQKVTTSAPMTRSKPASGVPRKLLQVIFSLRQGEPTMVQTRAGFVVAVVTDIAEPRPGSDQPLEARIARSLDQTMQTNVLDSYAAALRRRYHVTVNTKLLHQISD